MRKATLCVALLALLASSASAGILGLPGGTLPPSTYDPLGGYPMTPFNADGRATGILVSDVPSPIAGLLGFSQPIGHETSGSGWGTWGHGYTGDVYHTVLSQSGTSLTMTLPLGTNAFYFYAEPNLSGPFQIVATAQSGTSLAQNVAGSSGASYYGFWGTGGDQITSIAITTVPGADGFAVGEFGINQIPQIPEPATMTLVGTAALAGVAFLRRRRMT